MDNSFKESIRVDNEGKKKAMMTMLQTMINSTIILSYKEMNERTNNIDSKLNEDEKLATYNLAKKIKEAITKSKLTEDMMKLIGGENLLEFIKYSVEDMHKMKVTNPDLQYSLSISKILKRIEMDRLDKAPTKTYELKTPKKDEREKAEREKKNKDIDDNDSIDL